MYSREEASQLREAFWTVLGQYLAPQRSADGSKVNWLNYKTGIKYVYFKMTADKKHASISIEIRHTDAGVQALFFEQFLELKNPLYGYLQEEWNWVLHTTDEHGKTISRIFRKIDNVNILNKADWPVLIPFFKPRIIALDQYWCDVKPYFEALQ